MYVYTHTHTHNHKFDQPTQNDRSMHTQISSVNMEYTGEQVDNFLAGNDILYGGHLDMLLCPYT